MVANNAEARRDEGTKARRAGAEGIERELVGLVWTLILAVDELGERIDGIASRLERAELQLAGKAGRA